MKKYLNEVSPHCLGTSDAIIIGNSACLTLGVQEAREGEAAARAARDCKGGARRRAARGAE